MTAGWITALISQMALIALTVGMVYIFSSYRKHKNLQLASKDKQIEELKKQQETEEKQPLLNHNTHGSVIDLE